MLQSVFIFAEMKRSIAVRRSLNDLNRRKALHPPAPAKS